MPSDRSVLERQLERVEVRPFTLDGFHRRRQRKDRNRRIGGALVALLVIGATIGGLLRAFSSGTLPANDPRRPFLGTWVSTNLDGSNQTMVIRPSGDLGARIEVHDDASSVCSRAPSTMTGTGRPQGDTALVVPSPSLTCDDGSEPRAMSGPPLEEQLRNLTFVLHPETDDLTDTFGLVWERPGREHPTPEPATAGYMWPQSTLKGAHKAQLLADAGDPRYAWQVDPALADQAAGNRPSTYRPDDAEIFVRFLRVELGWAEFRWSGLGYTDVRYADDPDTYAVEFIRCAPSRSTQNGPDRGCGPTIGELRYETVRIFAAQPARRGCFGSPTPCASPSGIWVVTGWQMIQSLRAPPSDAEATELLETFLQARIDGEGAEEFLGGVDIPLLYATTSGAPYERFSIEGRVQGPEWPLDPTEFKVRLFAEGGRTVVEQSFSVSREENGRLALGYGPCCDIPGTTENGKAAGEPYSFLHGEVTFAAAVPWETSPFRMPGNQDVLVLHGVGGLEERIHVVADPLPVGTGCQEGPAPADAEALARSIRSDADLETTSPAAVAVGGTQALRMDVVTASGASQCGEFPTGPGAWALRGVALDHGQRMRLYLLDLPGGSGRILAIAIVAPEARFEAVMEAARPIVDSFAFRTR